MEISNTIHNRYPFIRQKDAPGSTILAEMERGKPLPPRKLLIVTCLSLSLLIIAARILFSNSAIAKTHQVNVNRPAGDVTEAIDFSVGGCNIWKGDWIPHSLGPAYTNASCRFIQDDQNCLKNGRTDLDYLFWRWKPHDCELPLFNAEEYLTLVSGKYWAFVGDSIARNHFQSFLCSLAQVEIPEVLYKDDMDRNVQWYFRSYNFILAIVWAPFLVEGTEDETDGLAQGIEKLHLDRVDQSWGSSLQKYDYIVLSSGQWYLKSSAYFLGNELVGGHNCQNQNIPQLGFYYGYRTALRTVFDFLIASEYKGVVFFRTFTPDHFENGRWDNGGSCTRTVPFHSDSLALNGMTGEMHKIQLEEFGRTLQRRFEFGFDLKIVDSIYASILRPDAHPGPYRKFQPFAHDKHAKVQNDCLHWCLPGAIDTWSAMLLQVLKHV